MSTCLNARVHPPNGLQSTPEFMARRRLGRVRFTCLNERLRGIESLRNKWLSSGRALSLRMSADVFSSHATRGIRKSSKSFSRSVAARRAAGTRNEATQWWATRS